LTSGILVGN